MKKSRIIIISCIIFFAVIISVGVTMVLIPDMMYRECNDAIDEYDRIDSEIAKSENNIDELTKKLAILDKKIASVCIRDPGEEGPW